MTEEKTQDEIVTEIAQMFNRTLKAIIIDISCTITPKEWGDTKDVMITEINVPASVQKKLEAISNAILEDDIREVLNIDGMTLERMLFNMLIHKGIQATVTEMIDSGEYIDILKLIKEQQCGIQ